MSKISARAIVSFNNLQFTKNEALFFPFLVDQAHNVLIEFYRTDNVQKTIRMHMFANSYAQCIKLAKKNNACCPFAPLDIVVRQEILRGVL